MAEKRKSEVNKDITLSESFMRLMMPEMMKAFRELRFPEVNFGQDFVEGSTGTGYHFEIKFKCWK